VGLYRTTSDKLPEASFDTAGPTGGALWLVDAAKPVEEERAPVGPPDPLADEPPPSSYTEPVAGAYGRILCEAGTGLTVAREDIRRGIRMADGEFIDLTEHLAKITEDSKLEEMRIAGFVRNSAVWREPERVSGAYWLAPHEGSGYVLALLRQAMINTQRAAVVRWTKRTKQSLGIVRAHTQGLVVVEMAWSALVRPVRPEVKGILDLELNEEHVAMAVSLVNEMKESVDLLDWLIDDAWDAKRVLREQALAGEVPPLAVEQEATEVSDLERALVESLR
jgi:DNA end-binding protein Ku